MGYDYLHTSLNKFCTHIFWTFLLKPPQPFIGLFLLLIVPSVVSCMDSGGLVNRFIVLSDITINRPCVRR